MSEEVPERKVDAELVRKSIALFLDRIIAKILSGEYPLDHLKEYIDWVTAEGNGIDDALRMRASRIEKHIHEDFKEAFNLNKFVRQKRINSHKNAEK